jgi:hypothetical protein
MKNKLLLLFTFLSFQISLAQKVENVFKVSFKNKDIGTIHAVEERSGTKSTKDLRTQTDAKVLMMSIHVESEVKSTHDNGILIEGTSYRHANRGAEDVHAHVVRMPDKFYQREKNGKKSMIEKQEITICVIDLFFREPKGVKTIFSNMYADFLSLKEISPGKYQLVTPDKKDSYYTYQSGKLTSVESNTPLGKVISKSI